MPLPAPWMAFSAERGRSSQEDNNTCYLVLVSGGQEQPSLKLLEITLPFLRTQNNTYQQARLVAEMNFVFVGCNKCSGDSSSLTEHHPTLPGRCRKFIF